MNGDTGLFSVRRPRETLGNINFNSAIPQPASALKRSNSISNIKENIPATSGHARSISSSRMSLAPNRPPQPAFQRSSSGNNLAEMGRPSTVQRSSSNIFNNASASRMSLAPNALMTPHGNIHQSLNAAQSIQRRSSVYSRHSSSGPAGNQSFFVQAPIPAGVPRDPRPLKDRSFQAKIGQELLDYLTHNNFELEMKHSLGQNTLKSPTQKDFNFIFQWLYHRIDPSYRFQKNIDAEVPPILKQLRYPYEKSITKSQLVAVGGQNWSVFLGMLHWMMQLAQMLDRYDAGEYDEACAEAGIDVSGDRIIFRFLSSAYRDWLQVDDTAEEDDDADKLLIPHVEAMAAEFQRGNEKYEQEMKILQAEHDALEKQIAEAEKDAPDLAKLDKDRQVLESDKKKFEEWNSTIERKIEKYEAAVKALTEGISQTETEISTVEAEKADLQAAVDKQGITVEDIDRMSSERERLQKGVEATSIRLEEVKRRSGDKESEANSALEELERTIHAYNSLCYQNSLIPSTALNANGESFECHLLSSEGSHNSDVRLLADPSTGYHPAHVLNLDLRSNIKSRLLRFRKEISERRTLASEKNNEDHELLDSIKDAIDDKKIEVEALEHRVRTAAEEHDKMRDEVTTQKVASDAQIERMEKELAKMRGNLQGDVQLMEQKEMNTNIELEQLTLRASSLREELHTEVERMLNNIIAFKVHIQKSLEDYENFVMEEVEQELGAEEESQMMGGEEYEVDVVAAEQ